MGHEAGTPHCLKPLAFFLPTGINILMNKKRPCPTCRKLTFWTDNPYHPFCSKKCRLIDLGAWADEKFKIPDKESELTEEEKELLEKTKPI